MSEARAEDVIIAVHELASNAVRHGAGRGRLRIWNHDEALCCQVEDSGPEPRAAGPGARVGAGAGAADGWSYGHGHGLWLARQVADQMTVMSGPEGTRAAVTFTLG
jgi:anti-sigma regulatory factor (Ser/Thr protein kinase)